MADRTRASSQIKPVETIKQQPKPQPKSESESESGSQISPRMAQRPLSGLELLPKEVLSLIGSWLNLPQWLGLRQVSVAMQTNINGSPSPFADRRYTGTLMSRHVSFGKPELVSRLGSYFHGLTLDKGLLSEPRDRIVRALADSDTWRCLTLDFNTGAEEQAAFAQLLDLLRQDLTKKAPGWSCRLELKLPELKKYTSPLWDIANLLPKLAASEQITLFGVDGYADTHCLLFIQQARAFSKLTLDLNHDALGMNALQKSLQVSTAPIAHLGVKKLPSGCDFSTWPGMLKGRGLQSVALPAWPQEELNCFVLDGLPPGGNFAGWARFGLRALTLKFAATPEDGPQLCQLLQTATRLVRLELAGSHFEHIGQDLATGLTGNHTLEHLALDFGYDEFPMALLRAALQSKTMRYANSSTTRTYGANSNAHFEIRREMNGTLRLASASMPAEALLEFAPLLRHLARIEDLSLTQWAQLRLDPAYRAAQSQLRKFDGLTALAIQDTCPFAFEDFPFDLCTMTQLFMQVERFDLRGIAAALQTTTRLKSLQFHGPMTIASGEELLEALRRNTSLKILDVHLCFIEREDHLLCVRLIEAILAHPGIKSACIGLDNGYLQRECQTLARNSGGRKLEIVSSYFEQATGRSIVGNTQLNFVQKEALALLRQVGKSPQEIQKDDEKKSREKCSVM